METLQATRRRLAAAGIDYQSDGGGGFELWRDGARVGRVYSEAALMAWREEPITVVGVVMMNAKEALDTIDWMRGDLEQIEGNLSSFRQRALDFRDRDGWKALGYAGFTQAIQAEIGTQYSKSYLSRLLKAAEIERLLELPIGNSVPESQLRELSALDTPAEQVQAWQQANIATGGKPTAKAVQQAVDVIRPAAKPTIPEPTSGRAGVARFGFTARALPNGGIGLRAPGDLESQHTAAHLAQLIAAWDAYPPIPADLAAVGVTWRYRTERNYYQVMIGDGIGPTGYTPDELFADTRDRMRRLGSLPAAPAPAADLIVGQRADPHQPDPKEPPDPMFDRPVGRNSSSFTSAEYEEWAETDQILLDKAANAIRRRDMDAAEALLSQVVVKTSARDELWAKLPDQAALWRTQAASLLRQLAPLLTQIRTEDRDGLSEAIADLNQCGAGQEVAGWLRVGWALLDLEMDA